MKFYRSYLILSLIFIFSQPVISGTSGYAFLQTDYSPRSSAMGGAFFAMRGDLNGLSHNPAGLAYLDENQFVVNYADYLLDIVGGFAGYTRRIDNWGQLSAAIIYLNYGEFDETDQYAEKTGRTYGAADLAFAVSLSNYLEDRFTYGITAKYIHSSIDNYSASAAALDFGLIYDAPFEQDLFIGLSVLNLGTTLDGYVNYKDNLPFNIKLGFSKKLAHLPLELNAGINRLNEHENDFLEYFKKFSLGGEFTLSDALRLRLGYDNALHYDLETTSSSSGFAGASAGLGFIINQFRVDYAVSSIGDLGSVHRFGFSGAL